MRIARAALALPVGALALTAAPAPAASARPPGPGAERFGDGWAIPAGTPAPAWFDAAYAQWLVTIRAGGTIGYASCTANFVFRKTRRTASAPSGTAPGSTPSARSC